MNGSSSENIEVCVPRSFHGPIIATLRNGSLKFSDAVNQDRTFLNEVDKTIRCFIGDFSEYTEKRDQWAGDDIVIEAVHGGVKIRYDDDVAEPGTRPQPSHFDEVFGLWSS